MTVSAGLMGEISGFFEAKLGLYYPPNRWNDLERALQPAAREMGFNTFESFARWLLSNSLTDPQIDRIISKLTVGETYFFREPQAFAALRDYVVPRIVAARGNRSKPHLRVWSAGCCTGEEAYSLAIFLKRECPELRSWKISITGTDLNPQFLQRARSGVYRGWSFRNAPVWLKSGYFSEGPDDHFEICDDIKRMVTFEQLNLAEDAPPRLHSVRNGLDVIFCRNVLMYLSSRHIRRALDCFHHSLVEGGCLLVGICETSPSVVGFCARSLPGVTLYEKCSRGEAVSAVASHVTRKFEQHPLVLAGVTARPQPAAETTAPAISSSAVRSQQEPPGNQTYAGTAAGSMKRSQSPLDVDAATSLGREFADQGKLTEARRAIEGALAADKLRAPLHYLHATILQELGETKLAAATFEKVLYLDPGFVLAHIAVAKFARGAGQSEKSRRHLAHALRILRRIPPNDIIAEADGLTAGRLIALIEEMEPAKVTL